MKMTLIEDWKSAWKFISVQANALGIAMSSTYAIMYDQLKDTMPPKYMVMVTGAVFVAGIVGRVISQTKPDEPK